ncbi:MAG: crossover junction endodeoxyribonuclease RuvC, partial [Cutibacterium granulosum]|nr:crossover junction endodeoxyribonuclease RuvC [Cutibacterium granulosum]
HGVAVGVHTPSEVKAAISGSGRADKAQVGLMVARVLHLEKPPTPADAADAVALAITHIWRGGTQSRIEAAMAAQQHSPARTWRQRSTPRTWQEHHLR